MKQVIVLVAIMPLLLVFLMQFSLMTQRDYQINRVEELVSAAKEEAAKDGYFTGSNIDKLEKNISKIMDVTKEEINIHATSQSDIKYRTIAYGESVERGILEYEIQIPIKNIMAGRSLFGISKEKNQGVYQLKGNFVSERLEP